MSSTLTVTMTRAVTIDGVAFDNSRTKTITVDGRVVCSTLVEVGAGTVKEVFDISDADFSNVLAAVGGSADFDYLEVVCVAGETSSGSVVADKTFIEITIDVNAGVGENSLRMELPQGGWFMLFGDGGYAAGTDGESVVYASLGTIDKIEAVRLINASGSTTAKFSIFCVT